MKILLVKPYNLSDHIQPSLGLGYLATAVRKDHDVRILDCIKEKIDIDKLSGRIRRYDPDVIGFQCYTFDLKFVNDALIAAKRTKPEVITIVGGPHPSALPDEMMRLFSKSLDYAFIGEAEIGLPKLLNALEHGRKTFRDIPGLVWREGEEVHKNAPSLVDDLDSLGMPAWDLIHPEKYPESQHGAFFKNFPIAPIMVTRGCPFPCTFCAGKVVSGRKIRKRSIQNVLDEIVRLNKDFGIKEFHIIDDNFTMDTKFAKDLLRRLKDLELGMSWAVPNGVRMDTLDEELLKLMKETGLYLISLGIESSSARVLRNMKKGLTIAKIRECVKRINDAGIDVAGFFIVGYPGETVSSILKTIRLSTELKLVRANFFTYLPFPGSESYTLLKASGQLEGIDWDHFYFMNATYVPKGMTRRQLKWLQRLAFASFYLRPRIILYQLKSIKSVKHFMFLARRFFRWVVVG